MIILTNTQKDIMASVGHVLVRGRPWFGQDDDLDTEGGQHNKPSSGRPTRPFSELCACDGVEGC